MSPYHKDFAPTKLAGPACQGAIIESVFVTSETPEVFVSRRSDNWRQIEVQQLSPVLDKPDWSRFF